MPFDSNGTFTRVRTWQSDAAAKIKIRSDYHDAHDADVAAGLSTTLTKDGRTQPTANLPMNNHRLVSVQDPVDPQDVATKHYVDAIKSFTTSISMAGADLNGQIQFTSTTGSQGLSFTGADLSWLARLATPAGPGTPPSPAATLNRLVLNTKPDGSGTDVVAVNDDGSISATSLATTSTIIAAGAITATPTVNMKATTGNIHAWWKGPADEDRMVIYTNAAAMGHGYLRVNGTQTFTFQNDGKFLSPGAIQAVGAIYSGQNVSSVAANMVIAWQGGTLYFRPYGEGNSTNNVTFDVAGSINAPGNISAAGLMQCAGTFQSNNANAILAAQGTACYLRPNGAGSTARQAVMESSGFFSIQGGVRCRQGLNGVDGNNVFTIWHTGTTQQLRIDDSYMGNFAYQCDYRIKKDVKSLPSVWEGIKKLRPISYTPKAYGEIFIDSDEVRWGLVAHEAQEALSLAVASGFKDHEDIQSPDLMALIAALAKGLQEAMLRIEVLEARA